MHDAWFLVVNICRCRSTSVCTEPQRKRLSSLLPMLTWKRGCVTGALNEKYLVPSYIDLLTCLYSKFMSLTIEIKCFSTVKNVF